MNEFEENVYQEIKNELVQSTIERGVDAYFTNKNELTHYYNVGKMIVDVQGGDEKAEYGNKLIKKYSERLTSELGKGYSTTSLKYTRQFYLFAKSQPLVDQSIGCNIKNTDEESYQLVDKIFSSFVVFLRIFLLYEKNIA